MDWKCECGSSCPCCCICDHIDFIARLEAYLQGLARRAGHKPHEDSQVSPRRSSADTQG